MRHAGGNLGTPIAALARGCVIPLALVGCGGDAFTTDRAGTPSDAALDVAPGDAGGVPDGRPFDGPHGDGDSGRGWCASQGTHLFCEDFDRSVPGRFVEQLTSGGLLQADTAVDQSPPQSMLATTPSLAHLGDESDALVTTTFRDVAGLNFVLEAGFQLGGSCFANGNQDAVTLGGLLFPVGYGMAILASSSAAALLEISYGTDGGISSAVSHPLSAPFPLDKWATLSVDVRLIDPKTVSVAMNGNPVLTNERLKIPTIAPQRPTLFLGASVKNTQSLSPGCKVHVDNVLFDITLQ